MEGSAASAAAISGANASASFFFLRVEGFFGSALLVDFLGIVILDFSFRRFRGSRENGL
jgi:hypothetical protein